MIDSNLKNIIRNKTLPKAERVAAAREIKRQMLNPVAEADFNPDTFDPSASNEINQLIPRQRKNPPRRLPTHGLKPKELMDGQMVGMFESKQELYLFMAHYINDLNDRIEILEDIIKNKP